MSKFADIIILFILTGGIIAIFIAIFISSFGNYTYIDLDGTENKANYCSVNYGNMYCINDGQRIMVKSYKRI